MKRLVIAELKKLRTTRSTWGLLAGMVAMVALGVYTTVSESSAAELRKPLHDQQLMLVLIYTRLFVLVLGVKAITDEFRHGTIIPTLLATPQRGRVVAAKVLTVALAGLAFTVVAEAVTAGLAWALMSTEGVDPTVTLADGRAFAGLAVAGALWAAIGVGIGAAVRHQVAAIVGPVFWLMFVEDMVASRLGHWASYLPAQAGFGLVSPSVRAGYVPAMVLAAWAAVAWTFGTVEMRRRDIS
jgi:ABC-2 type transport system permease protein